MAGPEHRPQDAGVRAEDIAARRAALSAAKRAVLDARLESAATSRIGRRPPGDPVLLSFAQERLWFLDRLSPGSPAYTICIAADVAGPLDHASLRDALDAVAARHEILRATIEAPDGSPRLVIAPSAGVALRATDLRDVPAHERAGRAAQEASAEARVPFDLETGPLLRAHLLRLGDEQHVLLLAVHHIAADGWSMGILLQQLARQYEALSAGRTPSLPELPIQYADYALWQRQAGGAESDLAYWRKHLAGANPATTLPADRPRPSVQSFRGAVASRTIPAGLAGALARLARDESATLYHALMAAFNALLWRLTGDDDAVVGFVSAGRNRPEVQQLIGLFVNTLVLRTDLSGDVTFRALLRRVRDAVLDAQAHEDLPFERLVAALRPRRDLSRQPLFQVLLVHRNLPAGAIRAGTVAFSGVREVPSGTSKFDLTIFADDGAETVNLDVEYSTDLFEAPTIERLLDQLPALLAGAVADLDRPLSELPLHTPADARLLAGVNETSRPPRSDALAPARVEARARGTPGALAIESGAGQVTYRDLDRRACRLARRLMRLGVTRGDLVAMCLERSPDLVAAELAAWKAGAAFVPLDPSSPPARIARLLEDARARLLVTRQAFRAALPAGACPILCLDADAPAIGAEPGGDLASPAEAGDLAYVIYTSGSTGAPRGVQIEHGGLRNLIEWHERAYGIGPADRMTHLASPSFDASVWELWPALAAGAAVCIPPPEIVAEPRELLTWLAREGVTISFLPTPLAEAALDEPIPPGLALRVLLTGGDRLHPLRTRSLPCPLVNHYGPTECTVVTTAAIVDPADTRDPPIGRPIDNVRVHVLDSGLRPVPVGVAGELYVAGAALARGYHLDPAATAERFVPDPNARAPGARLYRTGDRARIRGDGQLEFLGRADEQVKIRGFRIEPAEVEAALLEHPSVGACAVAVRQVGGDRRLVAWVTPAGPGAPASAELRRHVAGCLPEYMVPAAFVVLDQLPLTASGKVDRRALPAAGGAEAGPGESFVAPRTSLEEELARLFGDLTGSSRVGIHDNFFDLGGHSLLATRLISRLRDAFGVELAVASVFTAPTVAQLAEAIEAAGRLHPEVAPIPRRAARGPQPLSFAQERLWFLSQLAPDSDFYNMTLAVELAGRLDAGALERAITAVVARHEALRTVFTTIDGQVLQVVEPPGPVQLARIDVQHVPEAQRRSETIRRAAAQGRRVFDLSRGPVLRAALIREQPGVHVLALALHHIACDGWSLDLLLKEVAALYTASVEGRPAGLDEPAVHYADYAAWQREVLAGDVAQPQLDYWTKQLAGLPAGLTLPLDRPRPPVQTFRAAAVARRLPAPLTEALRAVGAPDATLFMTLLAALSVLLARFGGSADVVVGSPVAGRGRSELEPLIGFFVNSLVLRCDCGGDPTFAALLGRVRETVLAALAHQDLPFERLVEALQPDRDLSHHPVFQVAFALQAGAHMPCLPGVEARMLPLPVETSRFDLEWHVWEEREGLRVQAVYNTDLFDAATVERLLSAWQVLLEGIASDPGRAISALPLMTPAERRRMSAGLDEPAPEPFAPACVHHLVEAAARAAPGAPAVLCGPARVAYGELDRRAARLAACLAACGAGPDVPIGVCMERSASMIEAMLGVLKAGAAYVPLDPHYPKKRLEAMLADFRPPVIVTERRFAEVLPDTSARVILADALPAGAPAAAPTPVHPGRLAYIIYTSGSTGAPKGVEVEHASVSSLIAWHRRAYGIGPADRAVALASPSFDASVWEIWPYLAAGASIAVADAETVASPRLLLRWFADSGVTICFVPTPLAEALLAEPWPPDLRLRALLTGGDRLRRPRRRPLPCPLVNHYGPTEGTVVATAWRVDPDDPRPSDPPIGRPIDRVTVHVLDQHRCPVPAGAPGEIWIGGAGLARGYHRRPELTAERFVPDPFSGRPGARLYRTGDLGRCRPDGALEFAGRLDDQVKIRGVRIEPGEVEAALAAHPGVGEAVVIAAGEQDDRRLVAYVVAGAAPPAATELRAWLQARLPAVMIPSAFVALPAIPLGPHGKLDRAALPAPPTDRPETASEYVAPRTDSERRLASLFQEVLGLDRVGVRDGFFDLGGHSMLAVRLFCRIEQDFGRAPPLASLFAAPTVEALAPLLDEGAPRRGGLVPLRAGPGPPIVLVPPPGDQVFCFRQLADELRPGPRCLGLEAPGLDGADAPLDAMEDLAGVLAERLGEAHDDGPLVLCGYCNGGLLALEIAQRLAGGGRDVACLVLLSTALPASEPASPARPAARPVDWRLAAAAARNVAARTPVDPSGAGAAAAAVVDRINRVRAAGLRASMRYRPRPYAGRAIVIAAAEEPQWGAAAERGWREIFRGAITVREIPCRHFDLLKHPHVRDVAGILEEAIHAPDAR